MKKQQSIKKEDTCQKQTCLDTPCISFDRTHKEVTFALSEVMLAKASNFNQDKIPYFCFPQHNVSDTSPVGSPFPRGRAQRLAVGEMEKSHATTPCRDEYLRLHTSKLILRQETSFRGGKGKGKEDLVAFPSSARELLSALPT